KGQYKSQTRMINFFLNAGVYANSDHLDPVFIGPHVNEEEVIANNYQHYSGDQEFQSARQSRTNRGKLERPFQFVCGEQILIHWVISHGCIFLSKRVAIGGDGD